MPTDLETLIRSIAREEAVRVRDERDATAAQRQAEGEVLLTSGQVATKLGTTRRALAERMRRARAAGEPHPLDALALEIDGVRRYPAAAVERYIAALAGAAPTPMLCAVRGGR